MPYQCQEKDFDTMNLTEYYQEMAKGANWTNPKVTFRFSSRDDAISMS